MDKVLILVRGIPGSGKTTFSRYMSKGFDSLHIEADRFFVDDQGNYNFDASLLNQAHKWCQDSVFRAMNEDETSEIIVSNTFTTEKELKPYLDMAGRFNYKVISLIVENRHGSNNIYNVPSSVIQAMRDRFTFSL